MRTSSYILKGLRELLKKLLEGIPLPNNVPLRPVPVPVPVKNQKRR